MPPRWKAGGIATEMNQSRRDLLSTPNGKSRQRNKKPLSVTGGAVVATMSNLPNQGAGQKIY